MADQGELKMEGLKKIVDRKSWWDFHKWQILDFDTGTLKKAMILEKLLEYQHFWIGLTWND